MSDNLLWATGRRKTSIAQVRLVPNGQGKVVVNAKPIEQYFGGHARHTTRPLTRVWHHDHSTMTNRGRTARAHTPRAQCAIPLAPAACIGERGNTRNRLQSPLR